MIQSKLKDTDDNIVKFKNENRQLSIKRNSTYIEIKKQQSFGQFLESQIIKMNLLIDELKEDVQNLQNTMEKTNRIKTSLIDLISFIRNYANVGEVRYQIRKLLWITTVNDPPESLAEASDDIEWSDDL